MWCDTWHVYHFLFLKNSKYFWKFKWFNEENPRAVVAIKNFNLTAKHISPREITPTKPHSYSSLQCFSIDCFFARSVWHLHHCLPLTWYMPLQFSFCIQKTIEHWMFKVRWFIYCNNVLYTCQTVYCCTADEYDRSHGEYVKVETPSAQGVVSKNAEN